MNHVDENEFRLLSALRKNARTSLLALARELNMPASTVHDKVKRYHGNIIHKSTALLDFAKLGYTRACFAIKTTPTGRDRVREYLEQHMAINNLHKINSGYDFLAEFIGKDLKEIEDFAEEMHQLPGVLQVQKYTIIGDLMRETFNI